MDGHFPSKFIEIPIKKIKAGRNIRPLDKQHVKNLKASILNHGQLAPVIVNFKDGIYQLIAGYHRFQALKELAKTNEVKKAVAKCYYNLSSLEVLRIQFDENIHEKLTPDQEACVIQECWLNALMVFQREGKKPLTRKEFSQLINRSITKVRNALRFTTNLVKPIREMVSQGIISYTVATEIARLKPEYQSPLVREIIYANLTGTKAKKAVLRRIYETNTNSLFEWRYDKIDCQFRITMEKVYGREGRASLGYLQRVLYLLKQYPEDKVLLTPACLRLIEDLYDASKILIQELKNSQRETTKAL